MYNVIIYSLSKVKRPLTFGKKLNKIRSKLVNNVKRMGILQSNGIPIC